jgi:predicted O-methyltransferase YrrM
MSWRRLPASGSQPTTTSTLTCEIPSPWPRSAPEKLWSYLELGTSNGFSTIWIARAARKIHAQVDSVDISRDKIHLARKHLTECKLQDRVALHVADCGEFLRACDTETYEFVFLDSDRTAYSGWAVDLVRATRFGLIVVDNATTHPKELLDFKRCLSDELGLSVSVLPIGNGQMIVQKVG